MPVGSGLPGENKMFLSICYWPRGFGLPVPDIFWAVVLSLIASVLLVAPAARTQSEVGTLLEQARDRKSTRLNSSHLGISYAVFCLKKKINNKQQSISKK